MNGVSAARSYEPLLFIIDNTISNKFLFVSHSVMVWKILLRGPEATPYSGGTECLDGVCVHDLTCYPTVETVVSSLDPPLTSLKT